MKRVLFAVTGNIPMRQVALWFMWQRPTEPDEFAKPCGCCAFAERGSSSAELMARALLLFQRTIPGFEPSPESFKISEDNLAELGAYLASLGVTDPEALDLFTALGTGLADQQISNDPGGDPLIRLIDDSVEMFYEHMTKKARKPAKGRRTR